MRGRVVVLLVTGLLQVATVVPAAQADSVQKVPVAFTVSNPLDPGTSYTARGFLYQRSDQSRCARSVFLLIHGWSQGAYAWDLSTGATRLSVARDLAAAGYPAVAVDRPGYGSSGRPNGYLLTAHSYAVMVGQMTDALRRGAYRSDARRAFSRVGLIGHSAGSEVAELAIALGYANADLLIPTAYTHSASQRIVTELATGDWIRAAQDDYEYFGGDSVTRAELLYYKPNVDPRVIRAESARANATPSGDIYSTGPQTSRYVMGRISVPVLLVLAERDVIFPVEGGSDELMLFSGTPDKTHLRVPNAGHSFMFHRNAAWANSAMVKWIRAHKRALPSC